MTASVSMQGQGSSRGRFWVGIGREQWATCRKTEQCALAGDAEALHDLRVALRRLRVWLRVSQMIWPDDLPSILEKRLRQTQKLLGPARDADIALAFVRDWPVSKTEEQGTRRALERDFVRRAREARRKAAGHLRASRWQATVQRVERFLATMELGSEISLGLLIRVGRAVLHDARRRIERRHRNLGNASPQKLHRLRIAVRRYRYLGEFFAPILGASVGKSARDAKRLQDVLGDVHDIDVVLSMMRAGAASRRLGLFKTLQSRRQQKIQEFKKVWREAW